MLNRKKVVRREFEQAALPHLGAMYGVAYRYTRNQSDAEDLVQEAVLRAYRFWHTFEKDSNCKAWLLKILTNTFLNSYHKRKRRREVLDAASREQRATDGVLVHERALSQRDPEGILLERMVSDDVSRALTELPDDFRVAVVLCDIEGLSYKEIAEAMDCPVGTVMSRLYRGRRLLQKTLFDYAVEQGIIKPAPSSADSDKGTGDAKMIDMAAYRGNRT